MQNKVLNLFLGAPLSNTKVSLTLDGVKRFLKITAIYKYRSEKHSKLNLIYYLLLDSSDLQVIRLSSGVPTKVINN